MEEKKYAFYAQGNGRIKTMEDLLQHGDLKQIRLAEISQEYGDDVSAHGTPIYETITHLKDVESDEQYTVHSHDLFKRVYVFAETENMDKMLENCIQVMEGRMVALQKELQQLQERKDYLQRDGKLLLEEIRSKQPSLEEGSRQTGSGMEELPFEKTLSPIPMKEKEEATRGEKSKKFYVTFSKNQIARIYDHSEKKDRDGKPLKVANIYIPTKDFRYHRFGKDENGIDRDERAAYWTTLTAKIKSEKGLGDEQAGGIKRFVYLDSKNPDEKHYTIHFKSEMNEVTGEWDQPQSVKLSSRDLMNLYGEQRTIAREKQKGRKSQEKAKEQKAVEPKR